MRAAYDHTAAFYDYYQPYRERDDLAFYRDLALACDGAVLELGCGTGRVLLPIARGGQSITGLDASPAMLAVLRARLASEPAAVQQRVTLLAGSMTDFALQRRCELITIPFRPFQHLVEVDQQLACLTAVRRHLAPGGRLVFDLFDPYLPALVDDARFDLQPDGPPSTLPDGRQVQRYHRFVERDLVRQVLLVELRYEVTAPDGSRSEVADRFPMRYFFRYEVEHLLARAGLRIVELWGGFDRCPFGARSPGEIIVVASADAGP
ncbi:MAG: class I SAM-dependent methyltransferase [Fimbriimonadaceae bacterium]|nr:class I SAM-dependent methyltransferase [Fimbriimonadaceae bacterium]